MDEMILYRVKFTEKGKDGQERTFIREVFCESRQQVIDWYGLNEPDIINYTIDAVR